MAETNLNITKMLRKYYSYITFCQKCWKRNTNSVKLNYAISVFWWVWKIILNKREDEIKWKRLKALAEYIYIYIYISNIYSKRENRLYNSKETNLEKLASICATKNKLNRLKLKRIGFIEEVLKTKVRLFRESLSFLSACEVIGAKDKYA